jgi:endonuclease/exonuclease/phosphatase family metal-dependent hydrolase
MSMFIRFIIIGSLLLFFGSIVLLFGLVGFLELTEFRPAKQVTPEVTGKGAEIDPSRREFTFFSWNIGYGGLGREMDFFYDGGNMVIPGKPQFTRDFIGIKKQLSSIDTIDFVFLQEVDKSAKRSWYMDEADTLTALFPGYTSVFATNYHCRFVPVPVTDPMGSVVSGLVTFSKFAPASAVVQYFDAFFSWPKRLVMLKRCYILQRFGLSNGKDLVVINTHNSAFDSTGMLRKRELAMLDSIMMLEYHHGNYVVAGGDWNNNPRGFQGTTINTGDVVTMVDPPLDTSFVPGWQFAFDASNPTNRNVNMPYKKGVTKTTIIDFFVVSPNVEVTRINTVATGFEYSDHQPVVMGVRLR